MNQEKLLKIYDKVNFVIEFIVSLLFMIAMFKVIYKKATYGYNLNREWIILTILGIILIGIMLINIIRNRKKIEKMFLNFMIPIGTAYLIFMMPTYVPDEDAHIFRAYDIGIRGNIISKLEDGEYKTFIPKQLNESMRGTVENYTQLIEKKNEEPNYNELSRVYNVPRGYFPVLYIFSAMVFGIGKIMSINPVIVMYLARIPNYIVFLISGYYSIKKIPFGKLLLVAYLFTPMCIQQAASISADSLTNSIIIFFIAYTLFLAYKNSKIKQSQKYIYYLLALGVGVAKIAYFPIVVISLALLQNKKEVSKNVWIMIVVTIILGATSSVGWYLYSMRYPSEALYVQQNNVNSTEQIKYIIKNPMNYLNVLKNTLHDYGENYIYTFIGSNLGCLDIQVPNLTILGFIFLLLIAPFLDKTKYSLNWKIKICFILIGIIEIILVLTGLYIGWTSVAGTLVQGIQGRYFIPIIFIMLLTLCIKDKQIEFKNIAVVYPLLLSILNFSALQKIIEFFC